MQHDEHIYDCHGNQLITGHSKRRQFRCGACGFVFESEREEQSFLTARLGDYFHTVAGYFAKCTRCSNYAHECIGTRIREPHKDYTGPILAEKKEAHAMKVEYNGFTGELVKLEREKGACAATITNGGAINAIYQVPKTETRYGLSIYDSEKRVTHTFDGVKLEDIKFLGGAVSFG